MRKLVISTTIVAAVLAGCGGGLSEEAKAAILRGCLDSGASQAQCECVVEHYDEAGVETPEDLTPELVEEAALACAGGPAPGPTGT